MNETAVLVVLGLVVAAFVLRPLLRGRGGSSTVPRAPAGQRVHPTAPDELAELELDRAMGRVSEADFARWRGELEGDIVPAVESPPAPTDAASRAESLVTTWRNAPRPTCPTCGLRPEPGARHCSTCGAALSA
jgi:cytochrome c-type biogenesis protein CcmI